VTTVGGVLAPLAFVRSIVSSIFNQSNRSIVWETPAPESDNKDKTGDGPTAEPFVNTLSGYVPISEEHSDVLNITEHPVEQGAQITDHAYKLPAQLTVRIGWSASSSAGNPVGGSVFGNLALPTLAGFWAVDSSSERLNALYGTLIELQVNRNLLTVTTGRRIYSNMLLKSVSLTTDDKTANALLVTCQLQEIILVDTQVVNVPVNAAGNAAPQSVNPTVEKGAQNLTTPTLPASAVPPT
jgi:hypothetical protein